LSKSISLLGVFVLCLAAACGPSRARGNGVGDDTGDGGNGSSDDAAACAASMVKADQIPLDMWIMLDQSSSMGDSVTGGTKWSDVTGALTAFVNQPGLTGVSVGIQYFGLPAGGGTCSVLSCTVDTDCGATACGPCTFGVCLGDIAQSGDSCTAADYAGADVEIQPLPAVASQIITSMGHHSPTTSTPTSAALQGAINHATTWAQSHASDAVIVVFATDGDPSECDTTLADIDAIAAAGLAGTPKIQTFVIGVGPSVTSLNGIAAAGGTGSALIVDTAGNVNQQFLDAMNAIRHSALGCQYTIPVPTSGTPNYNAVNVVYTPGTGGGSQTFPYVMTQANCPTTGNGWYYDNPASPSQIILCDPTCTEVKGDTSGEVDITLGCATVVP
jgi:hypothetical protein